MNAADIFSRIAELGHVSRLHDMQLTYHFEIEKAGQWTVSVRDGDILVISGLTGRADAELRCDEQDFIQFADGRRAAVLIMQGRLQMRGDLEALLKLRPLFSVAMRINQHAAEEARQ